MSRKLLTTILAGLLLASGCEKKVLGPPRSAVSMTYLSADAAPTPRYIAERHELEIITQAAELQKSWDSLVAFCATIQCEVTSSSFTARTADSPPSGTISLRVAPQDLSKLLTYIQSLGKIAQHTTEREDKMAEVVDTDAKLKNLTAFRDNLRAMLSRPSATVKDLIEIQQRLTETQAQLDSEAAQRNNLANETEKIAVTLSFRVNEAGGSAWGLGQMGDALRASGSILAGSAAVLITVILAVIPWLILIVPGLWLLARTWRKLRRNRGASLPPGP